MLGLTWQEEMGKNTEFLHDAPANCLCSASLYLPSAPGPFLHGTSSVDPLLSMLAALGLSLPLMVQVLWLLGVAVPLLIFLSAQAFKMTLSIFYSGFPWFTEKIYQVTECTLLLKMGLFFLSR